jgi:hypothetical protein
MVSYPKIYCKVCDQEVVRVSQRGRPRKTHAACAKPEDWKKNYPLAPGEKLVAYSHEENREPGQPPVVQFVVNTNSSAEEPNFVAVGNNDAFWAAIAQKAQLAREESK